MHVEARASLPDDGETPSWRMGVGALVVLSAQVPSTTRAGAGSSTHGVLITHDTRPRRPVPPACLPALHLIHILSAVVFAWHAG